MYRLIRLGSWIVLSYLVQGFVYNYSTMDYQTILADPRLIGWDPGLLLFSHGKTGHNR